MSLYFLPGNVTSNSFPNITYLTTYLTTDLEQNNISGDLLTEFEANRLAIKRATNKATELSKSTTVNQLNIISNNELIDLGTKSKAIEK